VAAQKISASHKHLQKVLGFTGESEMLKHLSYLDYHTAFFLPLWHALLYGVVKKFVQYILPPPKRAGQAPKVSKVGAGEGEPVKLTKGKAGALAKTIRAQLTRQAASPLEPRHIARIKAAAVNIWEVREGGRKYKCVTHYR
jgi:hypothetical protein